MGKNAYEMIFCHIVNFEKIGFWEKKSEFFDYLTEASVQLRNFHPLRSLFLAETNDFSYQNLNNFQNLVICVSLLMKNGRSIIDIFFW